MNKEQTHSLQLPSKQGDFEKASLAFSGARGFWLFSPGKSSKKKNYKKIKVKPTRLDQKSIKEILLNHLRKVKPPSKMLNHLQGITPPRKQSALEKPSLGFSCGRGFWLLLALVKVARKYH